ncbi:MAG: addiction module protein [Akkermansiaceae bacterium]|nr:addiction module protein [Akkermansiaceae bacterium]NNM29767.1 addiction module protein [Akkermansiaceae bacterium]
MSGLDAVLEQAMDLSEEERSVLASRLLASLGDAGELNAEWREELERRIAAVDRGEAKLIPAEEAWARVQERFEG